MAIQFADRVRVVTATTGTGTISLGAAVSGYRTFATAVTDSALASGCTVYYAIQDGVNWECGTGIYTAASPDTLTRTVNSSSSGGTTLISLSGSAQVCITQTQLSSVSAVLSSGSINNTTIGLTTASSGAFTSLNATSTVGGTGFTAYFASPPPIGSTSASTGTFTTLSASSTVSGTGFAPYALLAGPTFTGAVTLPTGTIAVTQTGGNSSTAIATTAYVQGAVNGLYTTSVAGGSNVTLTAANAANAIIVLTGALTANITVSVPAASSSGQWIVYNNTTGAFTLTFINAGGAGVLLSQGAKNQVYSDGTNIVWAVNSNAAVSIQWTGGTLVTNNTYYFSIVTPYAGTITSMDSYSGTGTFTANVGIVATITGTPTSVTGLAAVAVTSTQTNTSASGANVFSVGQVIQVIITSIASSPTNAVLNLRITKS